MGYRIRNSSRRAVRRAFARSLILLIASCPRGARTREPSAYFFTLRRCEQCIDPAGIEAVCQQLSARLIKGVIQSGIARRLSARAFGSRLRLVEFSEVLPQNGTAFGSAQLDIEHLAATLLPFELIAAVPMITLRLESLLGVQELALDICQFRQPTGLCDLMPAGTRRATLRLFQLAAGLGRLR